MTTDTTGKPTPGAAGGSGSSTSGPSSYDFSHDAYHYRDSQRPGRTLTAMKREQGYALVQRQGKMVIDMWFLSAEEMNSLGRDMLNLTQHVCRPEPVTKR